MGLVVLFGRPWWTLVIQPAFWKNKKVNSPSFCRVQHQRDQPWIGRALIREVDSQTVSTVCILCESRTISQEW